MAKFNVKIEITAGSQKGKICMVNKEMADGLIKAKRAKLVKTDSE